MRCTERVEELSEDIDVAIREFLERHPHTSARHIRKAMQFVERDARGAHRSALRALALLLTFLLGAALGALVL